MSGLMRPARYSRPQALIEFEHGASRNGPGNSLIFPAQLVLDYDAGFSISRLARKYKMNHQAISGHLSRLGVHVRSHGEQARITKRLALIRSIAKKLKGSAQGGE